MADKLSWTELRRLIANRAGMSEKNVNTFLNSFNAQIIEALKTDRQVKINGLGTFKLQAVAPRKSVNVKTGEEITISGYNKVVFTSEAGVKELVEKGERLKLKGENSPAEPIDPLQKLSAQAEEIVDILGELGQMPNEGLTSPNGPLPAEPEAAEKPEEPVAEPVIEPVAEPVVEPVAEPVVEPVIEPVKPEEAEEPVNLLAEQEKPKKRRYNFWRDTLICVVILLIVLVIGFFFFRDKISNLIHSMVEDNKKELIVETSDSETTAETITMENEGQAAVPAETEKPSVVNQPVIEESAVAEEIVYTKWLKTETIRKGSRLAWISKKYYGSKIYWPYIYDANKDHLKNPNHIKIGTPIRVPKLTALQKDTTNAQTMATLERLLKAAEAQMK